MVICASARSDDRSFAPSVHADEDLGHFFVAHRPFEHVHYILILLDGAQLLEAVWVL